MRVLPFMLAVFCGRMVRWLVLSLLVLKLGPGAVDVVAHHALTAVGIVGVLAVGGFAWCGYAGGPAGPAAGNSRKRYRTVSEIGRVPNAVFAGFRHCASRKKQSKN